MIMYIPIFEIKDSYIIKNILGYDTSYNQNLSEGKLLYTDYDIPRKLQTNNSENFDSILIDKNLDVNYQLTMNYLGDVYTINIDDDVEHTNSWVSGDTITNVTGSTIDNSNNYQEFKLLENTSISVGESVVVEIYKNLSTGNTIDWTYVSTVADEGWFLSGLTYTDGITFYDDYTPTLQHLQWVVSGTTSSIGYNSGTTNWVVNYKSPLLKYDSKVLYSSGTTIQLEYKIDGQLFNDFSEIGDVKFRIISNNHCKPSYTSIYDKLKYYKYYNNFYYNVSLNHLEIVPLKNEKDIYFNYDKCIVKLESTGFGYVTETGNANDTQNTFVYPSGITYWGGVYHNESNLYVSNTNTYTYNFNTNNVYNKYTLAYVLDPLNLSGDTMYRDNRYNVISGNTTSFVVDNTTWLSIGDTLDIITDTKSVYTNFYNRYTVTVSNVLGNTISFNETITGNTTSAYKNTSIVTVGNFQPGDEQDNYDSNYITLTVGDSSIFKEYTFVELNTSGGTYFNSIIKNISGNTITLIRPFDYNNVNDIHDISLIRNINTYREISDLLDKTFENFNNGNYRHLDIKTRRMIYKTYAEIINKEEYNQEIRDNITGLLFENDNNKMVMKIYNNENDSRLTFSPTDIVILGKDNKTSIPIIF